MFKWSDHAGLEQDLLAYVNSGVSAGKTGAQTFREFAAIVNRKYSAAVSAKAVEVKYAKLTRGAPRTGPGPSPVAKPFRRLSAQDVAKREEAARRVRLLLEQGSGLLRAIDTVADELGLSPRQVRWGYDRAKVTPVQSSAAQAFDSAATGAQSATAHVDFSSSESILIDAISDLVTYGRRVEHFDLAAFAAALGALARAAANPVKTAEAETAELRRQLASTEQRLQEAEAAKLDLKQEVDQLRRKLDRGLRIQQEVEELRKDLNFTLTEWVNDPFGKMRATTDRLRIILDRFDNVVAVTSEFELGAPQHDGSGQ